MHSTFPRCESMPLVFGIAKNNLDENAIKVVKECQARFAKKSRKTLGSKKGFFATSQIMPQIHKMRRKLTHRLAKVGSFKGLIRKPITKESKRNPSSFSAE